LKSQRKLFPASPAHMLILRRAAVPVKPSCVVSAPRVGVIRSRSVLTVVVVLMGSSFLSKVHDASDQEGVSHPITSYLCAPTAASRYTSAQQRFSALAHFYRRLRCSNSGSFMRRSGHDELSAEVGDGANRKGGISWGCLTTSLLHRRSD